MLEVAAALKNPQRESEWLAGEQGGGVSLSDTDGGDTQTAEELPAVFVVDEDGYPVVGALADCGGELSFTASSERDASLTLQLVDAQGRVLDLGAIDGHCD